MTFLFFRYLTEKRNLLVQFFSKQEEDRKEILETTGYSCFQIFSVLISKIILQESLTSNFWQEDGSSCILWEFPGKDAISGCRMRGEKLGFFSVFSVLSLIPPFRERRSYGQKFLSFFLFFFFKTFLAVEKFLSTFPMFQIKLSRRVNRSRPVRVGIKSGR